MRISERCFAVLGLGYSPPWCVNSGFIVGDATTLIIDTGGNALAAATIHGYAAAIRPSNAMKAINTEKHFDHIGGNSFFRGQGVEIWAHSSGHRTEEEFLEEKAHFNQCIPDPARRAAHEENSFFSGTRLVNPTQPLKEETIFELGNCVVEVLFTPGHTSTNLSIWVPRERVLFTGDCMINGYAPNLDSGAPADWRIWLKSLNRIEALRPRTIVAGHGPVAHDDEISRILKTVRRILEESIERGCSPSV